MKTNNLDSNIIIDNNSINNIYSHSEGISDSINGIFSHEEGVSTGAYKIWTSPDTISDGNISIDQSNWAPHYYNYNWYMYEYTKNILIKYKNLSDEFIREYDYGSIYLYPSCIIGTFTKGNWQYWNNSVFSEFEPIIKFDNIKNDTKFILLNQFDNEITNEELINCVKDKDFYYSFIHNQLNKNLNNENIDTKCNIHHKLDELLKL